MLWRIVRARQAERMAPARGAFVENHQFGMKVVGQRDCEEQKNEGAGKGGPFLQGLAPTVAALVQPASPPEAESACSNCDPQKIEKRLHHSLLPTCSTGAALHQPQDKSTTNRDFECKQSDILVALYGRATISDGCPVVARSTAREYCSAAEPARQMSR